jgi:hypothetical protein
MEDQNGYPTVSKHTGRKRTTAKIYGGRTMNPILDTDTIQAHEGIRDRAEDIQRTLFLDRDDDYEPEDVIECE